MFAEPSYGQHSDEWRGMADYYLGEVFAPFY
jgi:hypothetical protein